MNNSRWLPLSATEQEDTNRAVLQLKDEDYEEGFRLLWKIFGWRIQRFARALLGRPSQRPRGILVDEEDVAQEVFLRLLNHARKGNWRPLEEPHKLSGFLIKATRAQVVEEIRRACSVKRGRGNVYDEAALTSVTGTELEHVPGEWPMPEDIASAQEAQEYCNQLLGKLRPDDSALVIERLHGSTVEEIAQRLNCTEEFIRRRYDRIIDELRYLHDRLTSPAGEQYAGTALKALHARLADQTLAVSSKRRTPKPERLALTPEAQVDPVDCTVFASPAACPGDVLLVQVVAHTPAQSSKAKALALEFDQDAQRRGYTSLETDVERGSRLLFHLTMPGLEIDQRLRSLVWRGRPTSVQFRVVVPASHSYQAVVGTVTVSEEQVPLGQITFKLKVTPSTTAARPGLSATGHARAFEVFFISYASEDRPEVLKRVQMLARLGKRFFQDLLHLDPGDRWEQRLYVYIDQSDAVLLFWSSNAKKSEWVMRECRYTIDTKGIDYLLPIIIEGPPAVEPPPELAELHMNDWLLYLMR